MAVSSVIMVIVAVLQGFYTLDDNIRRIDRDIQLYVITAFTALAFVPILVMAILLILPRKTYIDKFGAGRFRTKIFLLLTSSTLLTLGAGFRCGSDWLTPVSILAPRPWYFSDACFYIFTFGLEACSLILYLIARVDKRFYIPDGASGPGSYNTENYAYQDGARDTTEWPESLYALYPHHDDHDDGGRKLGNARYAPSFSAQSTVTANTFSTYNTYSTYEKQKSMMGDPRRSSYAPSVLSVDPKTGRYSVAPLSLAGESTATLMGAPRAPEELHMRAGGR